MQRLNAASCLFFALLSAAAVCRAGGPLKVEVVQTHTGVKLGSHGLELASDPRPVWSRCSGNSGSYSKEFGFHCGDAKFSGPEFQGRGDSVFFYDVRVIMPDDARLVFHCSTIVDRDCAGFPEYPDSTSVECLDFVYGGTAYKDCTATAPSAERIGVYRASLHGARMTIFGSNWRRSYLQYGTWQMEDAVAQDSKPSQDPKPSPDAETSQDPKPAQTSEAKSSPAPDDKSTQPTAPATAPNPTAPILSGVADQAIDPRVIEQAKAGDALAQYKLGYDYFLGRGVPVDYVQAAIWWRKAADQGYPQAQNNLGVLYNSGKGVPQSYAEAYFWQNLAAARVSGSLQTQFAKNRDESASKLWFIARLKVQQRAAKWAAEHPVQPRSHEPTDAKRGDYP